MKGIFGLVLFAISVLAFRWCAGEMATQLWGVEARAEIHQVGRNEPRGRFPAFRARYEFVTADADRAYGTAPVRRGAGGGWLRVKYLRHDPSWNTPATLWYAASLMVLLGAPAWILTYSSARQFLGKGSARSGDPEGDDRPAPALLDADLEASGSLAKSRVGCLGLSVVLAAVAVGLNLAWFFVQERGVDVASPQSDRVAAGVDPNAPTRVLARGATLGNQVNGSAVAFEDDAVYGAVWREAAGASGPEPGLYRFSPGGSKLVGESGVTAHIYRGIQLLDGWLYYIGMEGIHRIRTDGSQAETLTRSRASTMAVVGDAIYFQHELLRDSLYRIDCDGGRETPVVRESTGPWCLADDGWIYYVNRTDEGRVWRIQSDGRGRGRFMDRHAGALLVEDGKIWFTDVADGGALYRAGPAGTDGVKVVPEAVQSVLPMPTALLVLLADGTLLRARHDGTERVVLATDVSSLLEHEGVLYLTKGLQTQILHRITLDGQVRPDLHLGRQAPD
ncbi:MAG: DUF5050 domain-containing protein [Opitutaceae bacterium]